MRHFYFHCIKYRTTLTTDRSKTITTDPMTLAIPKASGVYKRVIMGVNKMPTICEIIGTDVRVSTSLEKDLFLFNFYLKIIARNFFDFRKENQKCHN